MSSNNLTALKEKFELNLPPFNLLPEEEVNTPKDLFGVFLRMLKDNVSTRKRKFLLKWLSIKLGIVVACLIEEGENFEELDGEIKHFMEKGVDKYYSLKEEGELLSEKDSTPLV